MWCTACSRSFAFLTALAAYGLDCAPCHRQIVESHRRTGMGRSLYPLGGGRLVEDFARNNTFLHAASEQRFTMMERGGRYFQRREQDGLEPVEREIHYVLGSGNHARAYIHRTVAGRLIELPVGWYSANGGFWAMSPGYDRPDHLGFRRKIDGECLECHTSASGAMSPIDCARCHGSASNHSALVNPARLSPQRQLEVCLQCHLESTSRRLPYAIRKFNRGFFSYVPGEPLENTFLHFDHASGSGYDDKFEIAHSAYRLLKSACFQKSAGRLTCTTCHDPHDSTRRPRACESCHATSHRQGENCAECHMPKRRTEDVVHVEMTDHWIQRRPPARDLLAPLREVHDTDATAYRGEVRLLYPPRLPINAQTDLYMAVAQVRDGANLAAGIPLLRKAIETHRPREAEFHLELADAYRKSGQPALSIPYYEESLRRKPNLAVASRNYAAALTSLGRLVPAAEALEKAAGKSPDDATTLNALGAALIPLGRVRDAVATLRRAAAIDADIPEIQVNLGTALARLGDRDGAIQALRAAISSQPDLAAAHANLAPLLGNAAEADRHFRLAIRHDPGSAQAHYNYGRALAERKQLDQAESEFRAALRLNPRLAEAVVSLGLVLAARGQPAAAIGEYRRAIQINPSLAVAHFNLAMLLARAGQRGEAKQHFQVVVRADPNDLQAHYNLGRILLIEGDRASAEPHLRKAATSTHPELRLAAEAALRR